MERLNILKEELFNIAKQDRSEEWFKKEELKDIAKEYPNEPVIKRRAYAIEEMLMSMTDSRITERTNTYKIGKEELIVGVIPMGSNGLGKVFPNYMTEEEKRVASITNKTEQALLGHNTLDYSRLLEGGVEAVLEDCKNKLEDLKDPKDEEQQNKKNFYEAVEISLNAVVKYAHNYSWLADKMADLEKDERRKLELKEIARICKKVPLKKPDTFYEALQSVFFVHTALHASLNLISLGRLDQVLNKYIDSTVEVGKKDINKAIELFGCFVIKAAGRLNLTTEYLLKQDHMDYNAALGVHPYYLDQRAGINNFLQNIIIGGKTPDGEEAANECTHVILEAYEKVNLSTPGLYARMSKDSNEEYKKKIARVLKTTKNIPGIINDDVMIPAMYKAFIENEKDLTLDEMKEFEKLANDYCVDGCWEPILNGKSDWTFGMINGMTILECALNNGATLNPDINFLRGNKLSIAYGNVNNYEDLKDSIKKHVQFFVDQSALGIYKYYMIDEYVNPCPLFSAFLGTCMKYGRDKSWGGTEYNIGGIIMIGMPDMVNTVAAIKKWVFDEKKYAYTDVLNAMRYNFKDDIDKNKDRIYKEIRTDFRYNSPKFGNNDKETNDIADMMLDIHYQSVMNSKQLADKVFLYKPKNKYEELEINRLRSIAGYFGESFEEKFGKDFNIRFTAGCGTFEQYPLQGAGVAGSSDRDAGEPLAPNFTPYPGTAENGMGNVFGTLSNLSLSKFAAGVITDMALEEDYASHEMVESVVDQFIENRGNMLTLAIHDSSLYRNLYDLSKKVVIDNDQEANKELMKYAHINVRVGGWQAPFISMSLQQQENYINRPIMM